MARKRRRSSKRKSGSVRVKGYSYMRKGKRVTVKGHSRKR